jgi:ComF family protein
MARLNLEWLPRIESFRPVRLATGLLDLLLPPACVTCAARVDSPGLQCGACFAELSAIGEPCCVCCGKPFELAWHAAEGGLCQRCLDTPPPFRHARAALNYDAASRRLVLPFKHGDRTELATILARLMALAGAKLLRDAEVLVPVPLHRRRLFVRRYNQSALLAQTLGRMTGRLVIVDALGRSRATASLDGKSAAERWDEVGDAFTPRLRRLREIAGRRVLLIDDVMTSGATACACAETLLAFGAASVDVLVAVRVPDPRLPVAVRRSRKRPKHPKPAAMDAPMFG